MKEIMIVDDIKDSTVSKEELAKRKDLVYKILTICRSIQINNAKAGTHVPITSDMLLGLAVCSEKDLIGIYKDLDKLL